MERRETAFLRLSGVSQQSPRILVRRDLYSSCVHNDLFPRDEAAEARSRAMHEFMLAGRAKGVTYGTLARSGGQPTPTDPSDAMELLTEAGWKNDHGNGLLSRYAHASQIYVNEGDLVVRGQRLGSVGSTGRSTGPHLHFEVRLNGVPQNPARFLEAPS